MAVKGAAGQLGYQQAATPQTARKDHCPKGWQPGD
jgi:hypothetical protein